jgi:hypothetical protein
MEDTKTPRMKKYGESKTIQIMTETVRHVASEAEHTNRQSVQYPTFSIAVTLHTSSPTKMEHIECSETLAIKLQMPVNHPEESIR